MLFTNIKLAGKRVFLNTGKRVSMNFTELNLDENLLKGINEAGYVTCTPVQDQILSESFENEDLYVQSQTGTGKTAAYLISIFQQLLSKPEKNGKKVLVLVPTRELAVQVEEEAKILGKYTGLRIASFYGGVGYEKQFAVLKKGLNVIVGTPGRVIDLQKSGHLDLTNIGFLVVDEADRMFDMGFYPDLRTLIKNIPDTSKRKTMLFSATLNTYVKNLAWEYTEDAKEITIEAENITVSEIDQVLLHVSSEDKVKLLIGILKHDAPDSVIIFCNTKRICEVIAKRLQLNEIKCEYIIGDLPQPKRLKIINSFKDGKLKCLLATDVAARGIDVENLAMVINYDIPNEAENYVHRIGRTARAGKSGKAITFCSEQDVYDLPAIERYIEMTIPATVVDESMFEEDKSAGIYIKTENHFEDDRRESRRRYSKDQKNRTVKYRYNNSEHKKSDSVRKTVEYEKHSPEDFQNMYNMSFEERMALYRKKYSTDTKLNSKRHENNKKRITNQNNRSNYNQMNKHSSKKRNEYSKPQNIQTDKTTLFGRIKAFFSGKGKQK